MIWLYLVGEIFHPERVELGGRWHAFLAKGWLDELPFLAGTCWKELSCSLPMIFILAARCGYHSFCCYEIWWTHWRHWPCRELRDAFERRGGNYAWEFHSMHGGVHDDSKDMLVHLSVLPHSLETHELAVIHTFPDQHPYFWIAIENARYFSWSLRAFIKQWTHCFFCVISIKNDQFPSAPAWLCCSFPASSNSSKYGHFERTTPIELAELDALGPNLRMKGCAMLCPSNTQHFRDAPVDVRNTGLSTSLVGSWEPALRDILKPGAHTTHTHCIYLYNTHQYSTSCYAMKTVACRWLSFLGFWILNDFLYDHRATTGPCVCLFMFGVQRSVRDMKSANIPELQPQLVIESRIVKNLIVLSTSICRAGRTSLRMLE